MTKDKPKQGTNRSLEVDGNVRDSIIILGDGNKATINQKRQGLRFFIEMALGGMLPVFGCLIILIATFSRHSLEGRWISGMVEVLITSVIFFSLLVVGFVLFMLGLGRFLHALMDVLGWASNRDWASPFKFAWDLLKMAFSNRQEFLAQLRKLQSWFSSMRVSGNWIDQEMREKAQAALMSIVIPGLGLFLRGRKWMGSILFVLTIIGYGELIPGLLLHLLAVVLAGVLDRPRKAGLNQEKPLLEQGS